MPNYNLNDLGSKEFELLIQSLLKKIIRKDTITFGTGPDGGREATFSGEANYPSEDEKWNGKWIFQAKYHDINLLGPDKARDKIVQDINKELLNITTKYQCDNYILATNVVLTPVPDSGTLDTIY